MFNRIGKNKFSQVILLVLLIGVVLVGAAFYQKYQAIQKQVKLLSNPQEAARVETQKTIDTVGKLIELPADETPTIATITDKSKLSSQTFFAKSENGDKVLIFTQAKKAILYRPSTNKVIEVGAVNIQNAQTQEQTKK